MSGAYYNEIDPYAAQWLRNLIAGGYIAAGDVDTRSIEDVVPDDLKSYTQCHFFAGVGVWSYALRLAGWPDNKPVWTASCPCQPFSAAGKGAGFADERHLWPSLYHIITERRPELVFGEQVERANEWFDLVQTDMETVDYAYGLVPSPAAGVGAPHIRDRAYWVADTCRERSLGWRKRVNSPEKIIRRETPIRELVTNVSSGLCATGGLVHPNVQCEPATGNEAGFTDGSRSGAFSGLAYSNGSRSTAGLSEQKQREERDAGESNYRGGELNRQSGSLTAAHPGPTNGFWRDADWLYCRDGKWRPVEPGTFPLAHGITARVGRLRAYGNAIVAPAAAEFIRSYMECAGHDLL